MFRIISDSQYANVLKTCFLLFIMFFSHNIIRPSQKELLSTVQNALKDKQNVLVHAPTGLGKTAAVLSPAIEFALKKDITIFFLTSRQTQHKIVHETANLLKQKNNVNFICTSIIGKKNMCLQKNVATLFSSDFFEYCKKLVENNSCMYHTNTKRKNNIVAEKVLSDLENLNIVSSKDIISHSLKESLCPYEVSLMLAEKSKIIICDYSYIFL